MSSLNDKKSLTQLLKERQLNVHSNGAQFTLQVLDEIVRDSSLINPKTTNDIISFFPEYLVSLFGPMAPFVLRQWNMPSWKMLGRLVYFWIEMGVIQESEGDDINHFFNIDIDIIDTLESLVESKYYPSLDHKLASY